MSCEPDLAKDAVLLTSEQVPEGTPIAKGYDWSQGINYDELLKSFASSGFQAANFGKAVEDINRMLNARDIPLDSDSSDQYEDDEFIRRKNSCTIFFGYSSRIVSSGLRETIRFLVENKLIDCIVTTAGGIEKDFIKCLASTYIGSFDLPGKELREKRLNRVGNLLVPNKNYCLFESWVMPLLDEMLMEKKVWTPSQMIERFGQRIDNKDSIYYWAAKNKIPVFCPALTDGALGAIMYFHSFHNPGLSLDILWDLRRINSMAMKAKQSGVICLGTGISKHHIMKANCVRDGADYAVYLNTAEEFDGSDSGAEPDESVACGKIKTEATPVKVHGEATLIFPLIVAQTFARLTKQKDEKL